jgi:hypothetical protein
LIPEAQKLVLGRPLTLYTPHDVGGVLSSKGGLWLSESYLLKYQAHLLEGSFLPDDEGNLNTHVRTLLMKSYSARPDLTDHPLDNPDLALHTDGSSFVRNRITHAGFTMV